MQEHLQKYLDRYKLKARQCNISNKMENPLNPVKNTRETWNRQLEKQYRSTVQFGKENPAWIPLETLLAMQEKEVIKVTHLESVVIV